MPRAGGKPPFAGAGEALPSTMRKTSVLCSATFTCAWNPPPLKRSRSRNKFLRQASCSFTARDIVGAEIVQLRRYRVQKDQSMPGENPRHEFPERSPERFLGAITFRKPSRSFFGERPFEHCYGTRGNFLDASPSSISPTRRSAIPDGTRSNRSRPPRFGKIMVHFGKIMILGREPEDGNGICSFRGQFAGRVNRRQRLVNAVRGTAKHSNLLPGDDGDRAVAKPVQIAKRIASPPKAFILRAQHIHDAATNGVIECASLAAC